MSASRPTSVFLLHGKTFAATLRNLASFLMRLPEDKAWQVEIRPYRKGRTSAQNRALFGVAYPPLMAHLGLAGERDKQDLHRDLCMLFFGEVESPLGGKRPRRTTTTDEDGKDNVLPWDEFSEFYAFVQRKGAELGVYIEDPSPMMTEAA